MKKQAISHPNMFFFALHYITMQSFLCRLVTLVHVFVSVCHVFGSI